jgi:hypothetical protein
MAAEILFLFIEFLAHSVILFALLWVMIKFQKLNWNFLGLLGSAFLAGGLDMIPHFGHLIAVPVLYFCITKVTGADMFPDAAFTVVIAYALMFGVNLFLLGAFMGNLRPADKDAETTNSTAVAVAAKVDAPAKTSHAPASAPTNRAPTAAASPAELIAKQIHVKGVTRNAGGSALTIQVRTKTYSITVGEAVTVQTDSGPAAVRLKELGDTTATLIINGAETKIPLP